MNYISLVQNIKEYGYSTQSIAEVVSCNESTIFRIETGVTKDPKSSIGRKLEILLAKLIMESQRVQ